LCLMQSNISWIDHRMTLLLLRETSTQRYRWSLL